MKINEAVILVGGLGKRLRPLVADVPKPMAKIAGKPVLEYQIKFLKKEGVKDIILCTGYKSESIEDYFKDGSKFGVKIKYSREDVPLGTAGAVKNAENIIKSENFFVLNGDELFQLDLNKLIELHKNKSPKATISLLKKSEKGRYGEVVINDEKKILEFKEKSVPTSDSFYVNAGFYIFNKKILDDIHKNKNMSLELETFPKLAKEKQMFGVPVEGYFTDIGVPEDYLRLKNKFNDNE